MDNRETNTMRGMMKSDYGDNKLNKGNELNDTMTIDTNKGQDEYTRKIKNIGGGSDE